MLSSSSSLQADTGDCNDCPFGCIWQVSPYQTTVNQQDQLSSSLPGPLVLTKQMGEEGEQNTKAVSIFYSAAANVLS